MNVSSKNKIGVIALSALAVAISTAVYADEPAPDLTLGETIDVTGFADATGASCDGAAPVECTSLRAAVEYANTNANGGTEYDVINLPAGSYGLTAAAGGGLAIDEAVEFVGEGADVTTIDGDAISERIMTINGVGVDIYDLHLTNGTAVHNHGGAIYTAKESSLSLSDCAFTNNTATWDGDYGGTIEDETDGTAELQGSGGAIYSQGVLRVNNCVFRGNVAENYEDTGEPDPDHDGNIIIKVGNGGAINSSDSAEITNSTFGSDSEANMGSDANRAINGGAVFLTGGHEVLITNSTFSYNWAISGGGINNVSPQAPTTITNTTISGNYVTDSGAGIDANAPMTLTNVTIANNKKESNNKGSGFNQGSSALAVSLRNVLFDNNLHDENTGYTESSNCGSKGGPFVASSFGGNVSSDGTCDLNVALGDQENVDPQLEALADNNDPSLTGTTLTHALPLESVAVDTGVNTGCPNNDQRGSIRPFDATLLFTAICDSGAYELYVERADLHIENMLLQVDGEVTDKVATGDDATFVVIVDNGDSVTATNTSLATNLPSELTYVSSTITPGGAPCVHASGVVTCDLGDVAASTEASAVIVATATTAKAGVIVGTAASSDTLDPNPSNNLASVTFDIAAETDLAITGATADPAPVSVGGTTMIKVDLANNGPADATGIVVEGVLPDLVSFVQGNGCELDAETALLTCTVGDLAADGVASVAFDVKAEAAGTATVTASIRYDQIDIAPSDNVASVDIQINAPGDDGGGFCSYNPNGRFDPLLPSLILMAIGALFYRRARG